MALRAPPGRAGRTWLVGRLEIARRGEELLERKRQALLHEQGRVRAEAEEASRAWLDAAAAAERWSARAALLDGAGRLEVLARHVEREAAFEFSWVNLMGARIPTIRDLSLPEPPPLSALGASSASVLAARACCEAVAAAARHAVAQRADAELSAEFARASRRLRALQKRWIPMHEEALASLDLALDENQREQAVRVRWVSRRQRADAAEPAAAAARRSDPPACSS